MYAYFKGLVAEINNESIVLETNSIGYNIIMPSSDIGRLFPGDEVKIYTYTSVREDAMWLYGFLEKDKLEFYKLLLNVNGIGPKAAIGILSNASVDDIRVAIIAQDTKALSKLPGIGAKTAGRIILDLKDKVSPEDILDNLGNDKQVAETSGVNRIKKEASEILGALGIGPAQAMSALNKLDISDNDDVEKIVTLALKQL
ncbi:MAG: Holliday junction branch migration protein RuvA [Lachnospiraceae bacterium]|nr:Holliday junction branch migration protein RuvA [Candidatus Colinaster scatohippi]